MPYIAVFIFSIILLKLSEIEDKKKNKILMYFFLSVSAIVPCILAGLRADSVGIDVTWYVTPNFERASLSTSMSSFIMNENVEILYSVVVYISSLIFNNAGGLLLILQSLVIIPVYIVIYKNREDISMWKMGFIYYFLIYNYSFSLMRQCIAGAFLLLALQLLIEGKKRRGYLSCLVAFLFHNTSIFIIILILALTEFKIMQKSRKLQTIFIVVFGALVININKIVPLLCTYGILDPKYLTRMIDRTVVGGGYFKIIYAILGATISIYILTKNKNVNLKKYNVYHVLAIIAVFFSITGSFVSEYISRISYYFYFLYIVSIPLFWRQVKGKHYFDQVILILVFILVLMYFWGIIFLKYNSFEVFPYILRKYY